MCKKIQYEDALEFYTKIVELEENNVEALCGMALCLKNLNEFDDLDEIYQKVIELDPQNAAAAEYFKQKE